ncbi:hypothetical protein [Helicobacter felis]|uniref:hypothetical protein n=1 Tax=Helicobacter felis TaxID=214 RepID=UPI000CF1C5C4|nr:hypothetical protein [Helicobacter felis]
MDQPKLVAAQQEIKPWLDKYQKASHAYDTAKINYSNAQFEVEQAKMNLKYPMSWQTTSSLEAD